MISTAAGYLISLVHFQIKETQRAKVQHTELIGHDLQFPVRVIQSQKASK